MLSLADPAEAVKELDWALEQGARLVYLRPAPVPKGDGSVSLGHRDHDPFWARVNEAGITVAFHAGDTGYGRYSAAWATGGESHQGVEAFRAHVFGVATGLGRYILDTMAALICHGVFQRFPNVRVCSIENGSFWVPWLFKNLKKAYGQEPKAFRESPLETFRRHISVAPYFEDDVAELVRLIGVDQVLFGSDFPHAEGLRDPLSFVHELKDQSDEDVRKIMRENQQKLVTLRPASAA
jgi:predicted TIM-barrel fold metal-dependent hydrolase